MRLLMTVTMCALISSPGAGHLVVVEGLSTCQDSHLTGKPRAGQGSPLRVVQGSHGEWEKTTEPCSRTPHHRARLHDLGAAMKTLACAGVDTALSPWLRSWWSPEKLPHCLHRVTDHRGAGCVCCDCQTNTQHVCVREKEWAVVFREVVDGKESKTECAIVLCAHRGVRKECAQRIPSALRTQASPNQRRQF